MICKVWCFSFEGECSDDRKIAFGNNAISIINYVLQLNTIMGKGSDSDLVVMVDCQISSDVLIVHFFLFGEADCPSRNRLDKSRQIQIVGSMRWVYFLLHTGGVESIYVRYIGQASACRRQY